MNRTQLWCKRLEEYKNYIERYGKNPSECSNDPDVKSLGKWRSHNNSNYTMRIECMKNDTIYNLWSKEISLT